MTNVSWIQAENKLKLLSGGGVKLTSQISIPTVSPAGDSFMMISTYLIPTEYQDKTSIVPRLRTTTETRYN